MRLAIITESYAPLNTSAAVQLAALAQALRALGHDPVVIVPTAGTRETVQQDRVADIEVIRLKMPFGKGRGYARRLFYEALMPFVMSHRWKRIAADQKLDGIVWYSPSIFHGIFAGFLKRRYRVKGYLILRDMFPDWAVDVGIITRRNPLYRIFKRVEHHQYRTADIIGVQTPGNLPLLADWAVSGGRRVEVLHNWYDPHPSQGCSIDLGASQLSGRRLFVYAGNIGDAQNMGLFVDLAEAMKSREDVGFVFVGRGSRFDAIARDARARNLDNILCFDEIASGEIPGLHAQCDFGIVSLHPGHKAHNIPGKFISYAAHELPILAAVNPGNDLIDLIRSYGVGQVTDRSDVETLKRAAERLLDGSGDLESLKQGCRKISAELFRPQMAASQVAAGLAPVGSRAATKPDMDEQARPASS